MSNHNTYSVSLSLVGSTIVRTYLLLFLKRLNYDFCRSKKLTVISINKRKFYIRQKMTFIINNSNSLITIITVINPLTYKRKANLLIYYICFKILVTWIFNLTVAKASVSGCGWNDIINRWKSILLSMSNQKIGSADVWR